MPVRCISLATYTISSRLGVIKPDRPMMSTFCLIGCGENFLAGNHHSQVDDLVVIAAQNHTDDVFADVVNVTFDRSHQDLAAIALALEAGLDFFLLHVRQQIGDRFFHDASRFDDLRQEHFSAAEQIAND